MGCFPGCFGGRKNRRRQRRREDPRSNKISEGCTKDVSVSIVEEVPKSAKDVRIPAAVEEVTKVSVIPTTHICEEKAEERNSPSPSRKRVTFDSKVKTYEHVAVDESIEEEKKKEEEVKSSQAPCSSEGSDVTSNSSTSFPSNHRYQNCRESDDEEEEDAVTDCDESDLEDDDDDAGLLDEDYYDDDYEDNNKVYTEEIADKKDKSNTSARDRTGYVNAVLNPIENLSQWKAVKSKGRTMQTQSRKENNVTLISDQEHKLNASFSLQEPQVVDELPSFSLKQKSRDGIKRSQEVPAVDASLSTWLSTSKTTTSGCSSVSMGVQSYDERPILGALTSEEIKQFSATNSPRKSPSRSPESPIIGTVGGYWNSHSMATSR
ncbi:hypothetical protein IGI04_025247 [Brassica rapa subsp. trilocularis]|uniref:Eisosome protein SEG2 n=1 Tax=Brassica rapa subsp. trilocularis TaxID=1813537 RepID=A0ABQ7M922_BRACM|nr:hypothetical protein IGI04_025247 [Brassica rapa subsp. trilocularis]